MTEPANAPPRYKGVFIGGPLNGEILSTSRQTLEAWSGEKTPTTVYVWEPIEHLEWSGYFRAEQVNEDAAKAAAMRFYAKTDDVLVRTSDLRFVTRTVLQQKWASASGTEVWKDVPLEIKD